MRREIHINHAILPIDGVLIKRQRVHAAQRADRLIATARKRASQLLRTARDQAENCRMLGLAQGYRDGFYSAALAMVDYLDNRAQLETLLETVLCERLRTMLQTALNRPELLLLLVDEWLADRPDVGQRTVRLTLPQSARALGSQLVEAVNSVAQGRVSVHYHHESCFIVRCGDQVARFSPDEFIHDIDRDLKATLRTELLPQYGQSLINDAIEKLWYALQERYCVPPKPTKEITHESDQSNPASNQQPFSHLAQRLCHPTAT